MESSTLERATVAVVAGHPLVTSSSLDVLHTTQSGLLCLAAFQRYDESVTHA